MAVDRLPQIVPSPAPPARDVRRAQQAFFQAALGKVQAAAAAEPPAPPRAAAPTQPVSEPKSGYRPGSLLDIKI